MLTQNSHDRHPRGSAQLHSESVSTIRTTHSRPGVAWIERERASATPVQRRTERSLVVWRRSHPGLDILTGCQYLDRPSSSLEADARIRVEVLGNSVSSVPRLRRWLATHIGMFGDRQRRCEDDPYCAQPYFVLRVTAQPSLVATQARIFNAARLSGWSRRFEPAGRLHIHPCSLRHKQPSRSEVTGDYPSRISIPVRLSCTFRPYGVIPWP